MTPINNTVNSMFRNFNEVSKPYIKAATVISGVALFVLGCLAAGGVLGSTAFGACAIAFGTVATIGLGKFLYDSGNLGLITTIILACFEGTLISSGAAAMVNPVISASLISTSIIVGLISSTLYL